jgi:hypothetical protein
MEITLDRDDGWKQRGRAVAVNLEAFMETSGIKLAMGGDWRFKRRSPWLADQLWLRQR